MRNCRRCLRMFTNAKCLRALCADSRVQRGRVQWDLACVSRKGSESRVVPACAREGVSTLGELPFRAGNNGMRVAILPSPRSPHKRMWKRRWFSFPSTRWLASFVNTSKGEQRGGRDEFVSARLRSTFQKY